MRQTTWTPVYFIAQLFYFIALVRPALLILFVCLPQRVLGSLLSAHLIIKDPLQPFGRLSRMDYNNELLHLAHDLGTRLLAAFEESATGIPHPRVSTLIPY